MKTVKNIAIASALLIAVSSTASAAQKPAEINRHSRVASDRIVEASQPNTYTNTYSSKKTAFTINRHARLASQRSNINQKTSSMAVQKSAHRESTQTAFQANRNS